MTRRPPAALLATLGFLLLLVILLVSGALLVRSILTESFTNAERIRAARIVLSDTLRAQLDEETGVRGYAVAHDPLLLEPFYQGRSSLPMLLNRVRSVSQQLQLTEALPLVNDAFVTNRRWLRQDLPLLYSRKRGHVLELRGKVLVDRFRADLHAIDVALARREVLGDLRAQRAIVWANFFALAAVLAVAAAAALYTLQEYRLGVRLDRERANAEKQRRRSAEMRAAYEAEKRIADTLQEAFAARNLPELPTVRLSATYAAATEEAKIGGDWYDALSLTQDRVLVAIGDVTGHGIEAAVAMSKARQMLIGCALVDPTPGNVLARVNTELVAEKSPMITAVVGQVDARTCEFHYASAGHPAPVLLEPGRAARFLEVGGLPLGVNADTVYGTHRVESVPGALLVLYTDGVIEHTHDVLQGETILLEAVESAAQLRAEDPALAIREKIFDSYQISDDAAILTIRFLDAAVAGAPEKDALVGTT